MQARSERQGPPTVASSVLPRTWASHLSILHPMTSSTTHSFTPTTYGGVPLVASPTHSNAAGLVASADPGSSGVAPPASSPGQQISHHTALLPVATSTPPQAVVGPQSLALRIWQDILQVKAREGQTFFYQDQASCRHACHKTVLQEAYGCPCCGRLGLRLIKFCDNCGYFGCYRCHREVNNYHSITHSASRSQGGHPGHIQ